MRPTSFRCVGNNYASSDVDEDEELIEGLIDEQTDEVAEELTEEHVAGGMAGGMAEEEYSVDDDHGADEEAEEEEEVVVIEGEVVEEVERVAEVEEVEEEVAESKTNGSVIYKGTRWGGRRSADGASSRTGTGKSSGSTRSSGGAGSSVDTPWVGQLDGQSSSAREETLRCALCTLCRRWRWLPINTSLAVRDENKWTCAMHPIPSLVSCHSEVVLGEHGEEEPARRVRKVLRRIVSKGSQVDGFRRGR